jgi:succinate dehydrogenase hydrophobic membrane anchor protein
MSLFLMQRVSALALLFFLTLHMVVVHYPPGHLDFSRVMERMASPTWKAIDIAFLFFVLMHALTGAYAVLTDYQKVAVFKRALAGAAIIIGLGAFVYGTQTILAFQLP